MPYLAVTKQIRSIPVYTPGLHIEEVEREWGIRNSIKLASNENSLGPSKKVLRVLARCLSGIHRYPESHATTLIDALAQRHRIKPTQILLGNGSNEIIELLTRTLMVPGDEALMADWTFSVYRRMVLASNGLPCMVPLKGYRYDLKTMASRVTKKTKLLFVCNPNNPTGTFVTRQEMDLLFSLIPKRVVVVLDEAYGDYVSHRQFPKGITYLKAGRNVVVLRTFSKIYGLAGLRFGYGLCSEELVSLMGRVRQPFNTSLLAQRGGLAALSDTNHVRESLRINALGRTYLYKEFKKMGVSCLPTQANFILLRLKKNGREVYKRLLRMGVIVRYFEKDFLRVTIGLPQENRRFVKAFQEVTLALTAKKTI